MIKFNYLNASINPEKKYKLKKAIMCGIITTSMMLTSSCIKNIPCDIKETHAHTYVNDDELVRYIISEKEHVGSFYRTDEYKNLGTEEGQQTKFENEHQLIKISDNLEAIYAITKNHQDFKEYQYRKRVPQYRKIGNVTSVYYVNRYRWTTDPNHSKLTGQTRIKKYVYYGYKITINEKNKYVLIKSEATDSIEELLENGYIYLKEDFYTTVVKEKVKEKNTQKTKTR